MADQSSNTPLPTTEKPGVGKRMGMHPAFYILSWIFFSNMTILFNKWLIDSAGFRYPILLTCWHLIFATFATQILARTTNLLESRRKLTINGRVYLRTILPIGVVYSGSLVCSNLVYLYLSVAFIQMLKSAAPVAVLFASWAWGVADPSTSMLINILVIVAGVALASLGEIEFSWIGFMFQVAGTIFEAVRLVMIQVMLSSEGLKMDPLVGLYYYAPVCAVMNLFVAACTEMRHFKYEDLVETGFVMLFLNALVAFMLNIASVFLIGKTSGLVMTLTGILKNILLVVVSVIIWNTRISGLQVLGYAVALFGLVYYSLGREQLLQCYTAIVSFSSGMWNSPGDTNGRLSTGMRRGLILGGISVVVITTLVVLLRGYGVEGAHVLKLTTSWWEGSE